MRTMKIRKLTALCLMMVMSMMTLAPAVATGVPTGLTQKATAGDAPFIKVKWEMNGPYTWTSRWGKDDHGDPGAQFKPQGIFETDKEIAICGIASDPDGMGNIKGVYADVYYPTDICLGPDHEASRQGCGQKIMQCDMQRLSRGDGYEMFCNKIKNGNNDLPKWLSDSVNWDALCGVGGSLELLQDKSAVYCCNHTLSYEDPHGMYNTVVFAEDDGGMNGSLVNEFKYLETPSWNVDFSSVNYGEVQLNIPKDVHGDFDMSTGGAPTVRNDGNTRLKMIVWQDDMGFGKTGTSWDVGYAARVVNSGGNVNWESYDPHSYKPLPTPPGVNGTDLLKELNLSEKDKMDFRVTVKKFLKDASGCDITSYSGEMVLAAIVADHWGCESGVGICSPNPPTPTTYP